ncbi:alpha-ketoglutarate-dependent dioxygenase AlkB family protein [Flavicella marina]|uniref:alpha-ketoglutarate-dependent dioxygenase AlkB family protein n=1 Tax=Flavicella marina TaxID=1475951 RepID=UPI001264ADA7|nr:alpha-ketoglutarate-dependent dioxygenase AlkB [Flavicella marina]
MDLFDSNPLSNKLPFDGEVYYHGAILSQKEALNYFDILLSKIAWKRDSSVLFGKKITLDRKVALYSEKSLTYTYAGVERHTIPWTKELLELKSLVETKTGTSYNSCLLNLYHSGEEGMGWHSDGEKEMKEHAAIASLSLGAARNFVFKHKENKHKVTFTLEKGDLLVMKGSTQEQWLHSLPKSKKVKFPRINLTFRSIHKFD